MTYQEFWNPQYTDKIKRAITPTFVNKINPRDFLLHLNSTPHEMPSKSQKAAIEATLTNKGELEGAIVLLDVLVTNASWFQVLLDTLNTEEYFSSHIAREMETLKAQVDEAIVKKYSSVGFPTETKLMQIQDEWIKMKDLMQTALSEWSSLREEEPRREKRIETLLTQVIEIKRTVSTKTAELEKRMDAKLTLKERNISTSVQYLDTELSILRDQQSAALIGIEEVKGKIGHLDMEQRKTLDEVKLMKEELELSDEKIKRVEERLQNLEVSDMKTEGLVEELILFRTNSVRQQMALGQRVSTLEATMDDLTSKTTHLMASVDKQMSSVEDRLKALDLQAKSAKKALESLPAALDDLSEDCEVMDRCLRLHDQRMGLLEEQVDVDSHRMNCILKDSIGEVNRIQFSRSMEYLRACGDRLAQAATRREAQDLDAVTILRRVLTTLFDTAAMMNRPFV